MEWSDSEKDLTELKKTILLKNACLDLREEFDEYQSERLNLICKSSLPKTRNNNREIPSRKASYKINALKIQYEIFQLSQWLAYKSNRMEHEKKRRVKILKEVRALRKTISNLKVNISTTTKGLPFTVIEVREEKNEPASPAVPTLRDVVEQYQHQHCHFSTQEELENVVALQVQAEAHRSHQIIIVIILLGGATI